MFKSLKKKTVVTIGFDPEAVNQPGTEGHFDNLAELLPEDTLGRLGSELAANYMQINF